MPRLPHTSSQAAKVFAVLLDDPSRWWHGYAMMQETRLASGSLYPLLIRLADDGFLESQTQLDRRSERARREYRLTPAGRAFAVERLSRFNARTKRASAQKAIS